MLLLGAKTRIEIRKLNVNAGKLFEFHKGRYFISKKSVAVVPANIPPPRSPAPQGFPALWTGDKFYKAKCNSTGSALPSWMDGFFFVQVDTETSGSRNELAYRSFPKHKKTPGV